MSMRAAKSAWSPVKTTPQPTPQPTSPPPPPPTSPPPTPANDELYALPLVAFFRRAKEFSFAGRAKEAQLHIMERLMAIYSAPVVEILLTTTMQRSATDTLLAERSLAQQSSPSGGGLGDFGERFERERTTAGSPSDAPSPLQSRRLSETIALATTGHDATPGGGGSGGGGDGHEGRPLCPAWHAVFHSERTKDDVKKFLEDMNYKVSGSSTDINKLRKSKFDQKQYLKFYFTKIIYDAVFPSILTHVTPFPCFATHLYGYVRTPVRALVHLRDTYGYTYGTPTGTPTGHLRDTYGTPTVRVPRSPTATCCRAAG